MQKVKKKSQNKKKTFQQPNWQRYNQLKIAIGNSIFVFILKRSELRSKSLIKVAEKIGRGIYFKDTKKNKGNTKSR